MKFKKTIITISVIAVCVVFVLKTGSHISEPWDYQILKEQQIIENPDIKISYVETAYAITPEAFTYAGGSLFKKKRLSHNAVYIEHPQGSFLFDTGLGSQIDEQFEQNTSWLKVFLEYEKEKPAKQVLDDNGIEIETIFLSHMHWDHVSGINDFPHADVYTAKREYDFAVSDHAEQPAYLSSQYDNKQTKWKFLQFDSGPYEIFPESKDLYNDGSIVFVRLQGHSPGSIGLFVNISEKSRYFFTGDLTWTQEGFDIPAEKFYISSKMADYDKQATRMQIYKVSQLLKNKPEIKAIPAHDSKAYKNLKKL